MHNIIASVVIYRNNEIVVQKALKSFLNTNLDVKLQLVDNSPKDSMRNICRDTRIEYTFNGKNLGFGKAHNIAISRSLKDSEYFLILNPDVYFHPGTLEKIYYFMEQNKDIGLLMPKVCNFDNSIQYLCKLLPTPFDLILRRLNLRILNYIFRNIVMQYDLRRS
ncbi:MAG: glycosyltransferase, partial [Candidatus Omnitrophica bacterium]|nr:glycosyltransferase [Candidatus Omnitrophota bacterium]